MFVFIVGLIVGPAVGILAGDYLFRPGVLSARWTLLAIALVLLGVVSAPFFDPELKFGLLIGLPLGLLLSATPSARAPAVEDVEHGRG